MNFTTIQLLEFEKILTKLNFKDITFVGTTDIENFKTFEGPKNELYISYLSKGKGTDGFDTEKQHICITPVGNIEFLNFIYEDSKIEEIYSNLKEVKIA